MNKLVKLLADNRATPGRRFAVNKTGAGAEILLYEAIVDTEVEAEWFGGVSAQGFVKALRDIGADTDIVVRVNSPGGSVFGGRAIETALREHKGKVTVHVDGMAASAASFVAMAGDEIVMSQGAMMMIHKAWTIAFGNADDLVSTAELLEKIDGTLAKTYADRSGKADAEKFAELMSAETWFTADEAVEIGLADRVSGDEPKAKAAWNLSAFGRVPDAAYASQEHRDRHAHRMGSLGIE